MCTVCGGPRHWWPTRREYAHASWHGYTRPARLDWDRRVAKALAARCPAQRWLIALSPGFTRLLHGAIAQQLADPWDERAYDRTLASIYQRFPASRALVRACKMVERGGL